MPSFSADAFISYSYQNINKNNIRQIANIDIYIQDQTASAKAYRLKIKGAQQVPPPKKAQQLPPRSMSHPDTEITCKMRNSPHRSNCPHRSMSPHAASAPTFPIL